MAETPTAFAEARERFLSMVEELRPELHRYCARLTGSVIEGEDILQDALAKAFYALTQAPEVPPLRPWLFRIAHNTAMDFLKSHERKLVEVRAELEPVAGFDERPDPVVVRAALAHFLALPLPQRSAVILKDVLGHSLEETAETMGSTVMAVKAALVRGRRALLEKEDGGSPVSVGNRPNLERYATLFNARDWDALRALIGDDCKLDLVSKSQRRGKQVGLYFGRYEKENVALRMVTLDERLCLAAYVAGALEPSYFILIEFEDEQVVTIRDFRYVPYIAREAEYQLAE